MKPKCPDLKGRLTFFLPNSLRSSTSGDAVWFVSRSYRYMAAISHLSIVITLKPEIKLKVTSPSPNPAFQTFISCLHLSVKQKNYLFSCFVHFRSDTNWQKVHYLYRWCKNTPIKCKYNITTANTESPVHNTTQAEIILMLLSKLCEWTLIGPYVANNRHQTWWLLNMVGLNGHEGSCGTCW